MGYVLDNERYKILEPVSVVSSTLSNGDAAVEEVWSYPFMANAIGMTILKGAGTVENADVWTPQVQFQPGGTWNSARVYYDRSSAGTPQSTGITSADFNIGGATSYIIGLLAPSDDAWNTAAQSRIITETPLPIYGLRVLYSTAAAGGSAAITIQAFAANQ